MTNSGTLTLTGDLGLGSNSGAVADEPETDALREAVHGARVGEGDLETLMGLFRAATLYVEAIPTENGDRALQWVHHEGLTWVPVFTSLQHLAAFYIEAGRGDDDVDYGILTGAELIDHCLPQLPRGTGMILDPISEHVIALPPVAGIVGDDLALPTDS